MTRAERSKRNRERHARERAALEAQWKRDAETKREAKREARRRNREAWWRMRYGVIAPGTEPADELPDVPAYGVDRVGADEWRIEGKDDLGYTVERVYRVTVPGGEEFELPSAEAAAEMVTMAVEAHREATREQWHVGATVGGYTVERVTKTGVTMRHASGKAVTLKPRYTAEGRGFVVLHAGHRAERVIFADEMAA